MPTLGIDNAPDNEVKDSESTDSSLQERAAAVDGTNIADWVTTFAEIYNAGLVRYKAGQRGPHMFLPEETAFLAGIGCTPQELYDFVEDWCEAAEPRFDVVQRITEVRRSYFLFEQKSRPSSRVISASSLPSKNAKLGGFVWLPRIIAKARAKLRGEMPSEVMYGCGADRPFLRRIGVDPAEFLQLVWDCGENDDTILNYVATKVRWGKG